MEKKKRTLSLQPTHSRLEGDEKVVFLEEGEQVPHPSIPIEGRQYQCKTRVALFGVIKLEACTGTVTWLGYRLQKLASRLCIMSCPALVYTLVWCTTLLVVA